MQATEVGVSEIGVHPEARPFFEDYVGDGQAPATDQEAVPLSSSFLLAPPDGLGDPVTTAVHERLLAYA